MEDEGMLCHGEGQSAESQLRGQVCCASGSELPAVRVRLCSAQGEGANQWKDERIRQVAATMIGRCGLDCIAKAWANVYLAGVHVNWTVWVLYQSGIH